jgi:hypothetical protein
MRSGIAFRAPFSGSGGEGIGLLIDKLSRPR